MQPRVRIPVPGDVGNVLQRIVLAQERFHMPGLPPVVGGQWGDASLDGLWGPLRVDGADLVWEPSARDGAGEDAYRRLGQLWGVRNVPARLELADGRFVVARFGHTPRQGNRPGNLPGPTCEFSVWHTEGRRATARWVGLLQGGGFMDGNLFVSSESRSTMMNLRLEGNYVWFLLEAERGATELDVVIDGGPSDLDSDLLGQDFNALQVTLGTPLQLDTLVGLDGPGNIVGAAGVHLGGNRATKRRGRADGPVPDDMSACWMPVFFRRLTKAMAENPSLPWGTVCNGYLDAVSDATIDGRYLKVQVALEAFARELLKQQEKKAESRVLVKDRGAWARWVKERRGELRGMLVDPERVDMFVNKVTSAMNLPSSGVVADALSRLDPPLLVQEAVLEELGKRNIPVHHFTMNKPGEDYDVDRDVTRIDVLRSLFVALIARACHYDGAIAGWVTNEAAAWRPQPGWWPEPSLATLAEASQVFVCERGAPARPSGVSAPVSGSTHGGGDDQGASSGG